MHFCQTGRIFFNKIKALHLALLIIQIFTLIRCTYKLQMMLSEGSKFVSMIC